MTKFDISFRPSILGQRILWNSQASNSTIRGRNDYHPTQVLAIPQARCRVLWVIDLNAKTLTGIDETFRSSIEEEKGQLDVHEEGFCA